MRPFSCALFQILLVYLVLLLGCCCGVFFWYLQKGINNNIFSLIISLFKSCYLWLFLFGFSILPNIIVYLIFTTIFSLFVNYRLEPRRQLFTFKEIFSRNICLSFLFVNITSLFTYFIAHTNSLEVNTNESGDLAFFFLVLNFCYVLGFTFFIYIDFFNDILQPSQKKSDTSSFSLL